MFASIRMKGKQPLWPDSMMSRNIQPAARKVGILKRIGWHTFRHTLATVLKANGEDVKVVQELLRHANSRITLDVYTQALTPAKREAQSKVANQILPKKAVAFFRRKLWRESHNPYRTLSNPRFSRRIR